MANGYVAPSIRTPLPLDYFQRGLSESQQRHDIANQAISESLANVADIEYVDRGARDATLSGFQQSLEDITSRYQGDLSKAASDITRRIAQERQNPWYELNRYQVEQSKIEQQLGAKYGPNAIFKSNVTRQPLVDPQTGQYNTKENLTANVVEASDYIKNTEVLANDLAAHARDIALQRYGQVPGYLQFGTIKELTPKQLTKYTSSPEFIEAWKIANPTYEVDNRNSVQYNPDTGTNQFSTDKGISDFAYGVLQDKIGTDVKTQYIQDWMYRASFEDNLRRQRDKAKSDYEFSLQTGHTYGVPFSGVPITRENRSEMVKNIKEKSTNIQNIDKQLEEIKKKLFWDQPVRSGFFSGEFGQDIINAALNKLNIDAVNLTPDGRIHENVWKGADDTERQYIMAYNTLLQNKQVLENQKAISNSFLSDINNQMVNMNKSLLTDEKLGKMLEGETNIEAVLGTGTMPIDRIKEVKNRYGLTLQPLANLDPAIMDALGIGDVNSFRNFIISNTGNSRDEIYNNLKTLVDKSTLRDIPFMFDATLKTLIGVVKANEENVDSFLDEGNYKSTGILGYSNTSDKAGVSMLNNGFADYLNQIGGISAVSGLENTVTGRSISDDIADMGIDPTKPVKYTTTIGKVDNIGNPVYIVTATGSDKKGGSITTEPILTSIGKNRNLMANFDNGMAMWFKEETIGLDPNMWSTNPQVKEVTSNYGMSLVGDQIFKHNLKQRKAPFDIVDRRNTRWTIKPSDVGGLRQYNLYIGDNLISEGLGDESAIANVIGELQLTRDVNPTYLQITSKNLTREKPVTFYPQYP